MWSTVKITYAQLFDFFRTRQPPPAVVLTSLGYVGTSQVLAGHPVGHVLFRIPPAQRNNVYVPEEKLQEVENAFNVHPPEVMEYISSIAAGQQD